MIGRRLQWATIVWNVAEVFVTIGLGIAAGSLALIAFGLDSLVEVFASLIVLWHMGPSAAEEQARRDNRARRLVAVGFGVLAAYLVLAAGRSLWIGDEPEGSALGIAYLAATAAVMCPIAMRTAGELGAAPDAFLMAVAIGASCAFLTPIGHQNNTLILGPGGFHFGDYWRLGLPLEVIVVAVAVPMLMLVWPL